MANANTYIGINHGAAGGGFNLSDFTIQGSAPSTDFFFYFADADANSNVLRRIDAIDALNAILRVLESNDIFTTEMQA
jgi:hypothetical protein